MLRDTGGHFGTGCGGASVATVLAPVQAPVALDLAERLAVARLPVGCLLGGRKVELLIGAAAGDVGAARLPVTVAVAVGDETCRLHLSAALIEWLQQPFGLEGALVDEEPLQRALLLELAALDLLRLLEARLGRDIRLGEGNDDIDLAHRVDLAVVAGERQLPLRLDISQQLAVSLADFLDDIQPPAPVDQSDVTVEVLIEAGAQDLSRDELSSLNPGDIVMLATHRPVATVDGKLIAPIRRQSNGVELDGPLYPKARRAAPAALAGTVEGQAAIPFLHLVAEFARATMTVGEIDALKPGKALPLSYFDETGVDLVVEDRRIGRGELVMIGAGMGVRILHLLSTASTQNPAPAESSKTT